MTRVERTVAGWVLHRDRCRIAEPFVRKGEIHSFPRSWSRCVNNYFDGMQSWWWREVMVWMGIGMESVEWGGKEELAFGTSRQNWIAIVRNGGSGSLSWSSESNKSKKRVTEIPAYHSASSSAGLDSGSQTRSKFHSNFYLHIF